MAEDGGAFIMSGWSDGGIGGGISWHSSSEQPGRVLCNFCGKSYELAAGEHVNFDDPRNCDHSGEPRPIPVPMCRVYWRSHGCHLPRFHDGDSHSHECEPCPPDCDAPIDEDWSMNVMADHCGQCSVHCGDRPAHDDVLYGEDADHFPQREGIPRLRHP